MSDSGVLACYHSPVAEPEKLCRAVGIQFGLGLSAPSKVLVHDGELTQPCCYVQYVAKSGVERIFCISAETLQMSTDDGHAVVRIKAKLVDYMPLVGMRVLVQSEGDLGKDNDYWSEYYKIVESLVSLQS